MTAKTRRFKYEDEKSSKFWEVTQDAGAVTVRYGKTGTAGQTQEKAFNDAALAAKHVDKLVREKVGKGYVEQGTDSASESSATEEPVAKTVPAKPAPRKASTPKSPLQDPEASSESLLTLLGKDDATNRLLARHPNASGELLERLSHSSDKATRQAVAGSPNTPPEIYVRLGQQFPKEFLANPALDVLLMVNPGLLDQVPEALLVRLLKQPACPASLLTWGAAHPQEKVQLAVAMNASAPEEALRRLRQSQHAGVRQAVKGDTTEQAEVDPEKAFEQAVRERLLGMSSEELEEAWSSGDIGLAQWDALPLTFRLAKASKSDCFSPFAIGRILRDTDRTLESLRNALPSYPAWSVVAAESAAPIQVLEQLCMDSTYEVRAGVAWNKIASASILESLSGDPDDYVRMHVARHPATPAQVLKRLAGDSEQRVLENVAANPNTPPEVLQLLCTSARLQAAVAGNPATPETFRQSLLSTMATSSHHYPRGDAAANCFAAASLLTALAKDESRAVRERLVRNPSIPDEALRILAVDPESGIRALVAENPRVSVELLRILSRDESDFVRGQVARSKLSPSSILEELAREQNAWVTQEVAGNPNTPLHVLESLAKDSDEKVRLGVAANPKTPPEVLQKLAADRVTEVIVKAVGNPETPVLAMIPQCKSKSVGVRRALAAQAHRSPEILELLWKDAHADVRKAVTECEGLSTEMLGEMIRSTNQESELTSLLNHPNLSPEDVEFVTNKLFKTSARESGWYRQELSGASAEVRAAVEGGNFFHHHGKDPNKAVLAKRPIAQVMALCAGPFIEPARLAKVAGSTDWLVRAAVARNSATPPNLLKKLAADTNSTVAALAGKTQSRSSEPQPESVAASTRYADLTRAATEVLVRLRKSAAENPGILISFVTDHAWAERADLQEVMTALRLLNLFDEIIPLALAELDGNHAEALWAVGAASTDADVRRRLAEFPSCPVDVVRQLSRDSDLDVLLSALCSPVLPEGDRDEVVKKLRKLRGVRLKALLSNPRAPAAVLVEYSTKQDSEVRCLVAANPSTPTTILEAMAGDSEGGVRRAVASNTAAPAQLLDRLSKSKQEDMQWALFSNLSASADVRVAALHRLAHSCKKHWVLGAIAESELVPAELLADFAIHPDSELRADAAGNPTITRASLQILSVDRGAGVRAAVARNPATPSSILEILSQDEHVDVRRAIAGNSSTPPEVLEKLADDADQEVRGWVALNPSTPLAVLESMAMDSDMLIRAAAARNSSMPLQTLVELAGDVTWQVRWKAVSNQSIPTDVRDRYFRCWVTRVQEAIKRAVIAREGAAAEPQTPVSPAELLRALGWLGMITPGDDNKALTKASRSTDWLVRLGVALHPSVSEGILKILRQDKDPDVARGARS